MNGKFVALIALALSPWLYLAMVIGVDLGSRMDGFRLLPFVALILTKALVLDRRDQRSEGRDRRISARWIVVATVASLVLVVGAVFAGAWLGNAAGATRTWVITLFALFAAAAMAVDVQRAYRLSRGGRAPASQPPT